DKREFPAKVVALSPCDDIALLSVERAKLEPAPIGDSKKLQSGEEVVALGYPGSATDWQGQKLTVTRGIVSKLGEKYNGREDLIQTDAAINPGNSGGPLVNMRGEVVGMNSLTSTNKQSVNYAISMDEAKFVADKLKNGKNIDYLGLKLTENYRGLAAELGIRLAYIDGVLVLGVDQGSPAHKAGIGYSDLIYTIDFTSVATVGEICDVLRSKQSGQQIRIDFTRSYTDGSYKDFYADVTLQ
ncbi:PDZ domain-containing protein, partial [bacterium]